MLAATRSTHRSMFSRLSGLLLALVLPLAAQETTPVKPKEEGLQVKLLAEQAPDSLGKVCLVFGETKSPELTLPVNGLSSAIPASQRTMVLKTVDKDIALCSITLPEVGKAFAVILVVAKPAGYTPIVVRTDDPAFKPGDVLFLNRSDKTILCKLGDTPLILKAGATEKSRPTGPKENAFYDIAFGTRDASGDNVISTTRWPIDNTLRSYLFFFTTADGRTSFRAVDEFVPPAAK